MSDGTTYAQLPVVKGLPVPYVARWSGEQVPDGQAAMQRVGAVVRFKQETVVDRDRDGWLWNRDGLAPGSGEPLFAQVHTGRQRRCMRAPACQVCGRRLAASNIPWLMPPVQWVMAQADNMRTAVPPTCLGCQELAARRCPHLRANSVVRLRVASISPWGVLGDVYTSHTGKPNPGVWVAGDSPLKFLTLAKQLIVTLHDVQEL